MFQNAFQNGSYFELFDPKNSQEKLKTLYKLSNVHGNNKLFDKELKTYVLDFVSPTAKICFPREEKKDLYLIQQYLNLQIYLHPGMSWIIEMVVSDHTKTKRRIIFSSSTHKLQIKPFFVKFPTPSISEGIWTNLTVDLFSFMDAFKGQTYRSLDAIYLIGHFKLRRIYTTNAEPIEFMNPETQSQDKKLTFLPKNYYFPAGVEKCSRCIAFEMEMMMEEPTQPSKNNSNLKSRLKIETSQTKKQKKFLANTNGPEMLNRKKKRQVNSSDKSQQTDNSINTPLSTHAHKRVPKPALKKTNTSRQKNPRKQEKPKKVNPWRGGKVSDTSHFSISKADKSIDSSEMNLLKTKNNLTQKLQERKQQFSDSDYAELSQKFSTVTDDRFKNELTPKHIEPKPREQEIEENIEMQTNSIYSKSHIKNESHLKAQLFDHIQESILIQEKKNDEMGLSSYYGFGKKIMDKFYGEVDRPYSPPLGEKDLTEENESQHQQEKEIELIYDAVLNCYYDHRTHTYYELKN